MNNEIDFVIPWVDGNDPEWKKRKAQVTGDIYTDERDIRYRDWGLLRYWFRGVEKFTPWVRKIWFICDQEPPRWLNQQHPKINIIRHEDYLPEEYRPAFSANPIELNIHRIKGLAEQFVYFNDDTFLLKPVKESFFYKNGLPRDNAIINPLMATELASSGRDAHISPMYLYDLEYLNCDYDARECIKTNLMKWIHPCYGKDILRNILFLPWPRFIGFIENHLPNAYLKSTFEKAWEIDFDILDSTSRHHIRDDHDVNQWLMRHKQLAEGMFIPRRPYKDCTFAIADDSYRMHETIRNQKRPMVCLNDTRPLIDEKYLEIRATVIRDFDCILSEISSYENNAERHSNEPAGS